MSTPGEPKLELVELAGGPKRRDPPLPVFCMVTFILMVPLLLLYWAAAVSSAQYLLQPRLHTVRLLLPQTAYTQLSAAWAVVLLG